MGRDSFSQGPSFLHPNFLRASNQHLIFQNYPYFRIENLKIKNTV